MCTHCQEDWKQLIGVKKQTLLFKKGQTIIREGDEMKGIFFIYEGVAKVAKQWGEEKELILRFGRTGDILGYRGFTEEGIYPISATAVTPLEACYITNDFLETLLKTNPSFTIALLRLYAKELHQAEKRMRDLAHRDVKGRIAQALQELIHLFGLNQEQFLTLPISRQDIASFAGTTYETVFKFFGELAEAGTLSTSGKNLQILQPLALNNFIKVQT